MLRFSSKQRKFLVRPEIFILPLLSLYILIGLSLPSMAAPIFRVNSGGSRYTSGTTGTWNADSSYSSGSQVYGNSNAIANTADPTLYQSERWNNSFGYSVPVANGSYTLNLYFAEIYYTKPRQRVFNVAAQSQIVLSNFDIVAAAGGANRAIVKSIPVTVTNGVLSVNFAGVVGNAKISAIELVTAKSAPPPTKTGVTFTQSQFESAIAFDYEGENGILQAKPSQKSLGYPCGVPNSYAWKFGTAAVENIATAISGRGQQLAGAGYNQVYNACLGSNSRKSVPNARIEFTSLIVDYYSISQGKWIRAVQQSVSGAAFAEDFVNNQSTGADFRVESQGYNSVRSGIGNASGNAGSSTGRTVEDGAVGFNFHGFPNRFNINWADAQAVSVSQAMRCIPNSGADVSDCNKLGYISNVGIDSWANTTSSYDNFATHGGVSGGRFKPITADWQVFTNYTGPRNFAGIKAPPVPQF
jgi:hypothetical protein